MVAATVVVVVVAAVVVVVVAAGAKVEAARAAVARARAEVAEGEVSLRSRSARPERRRRAGRLPKSPARLPITGQPLSLDVEHDRASLRHDANINSIPVPVLYR